MLTTNMKALRAHPLYHDALFLVLWEANMTFLEVSLGKDMLSAPEYGGPDKLRVVSYDKSAEQRPGVTTGREQKVGGQLYLYTMLSHSILYRVSPDHMVTCDPKRAIVVLGTQLCHYKREIIIRNDARLGDNKEVFGGKGKNGEHKDDRIMCLILGLYWSNRIKQDPYWLSEFVRLGIDI